ncbi:MAG: NUDIX hydrolase [Nitriliruptor sp.]|uniref:NUDIX domain-containing protein n=1 Tax=Nitriliruptor sp. TaxID=2448056 RepID=UPI0034A0679E
MSTPPEPAGGATWFETLDEDVVYDGFSTVVRETVSLPGGGEMQREVVRHDDAVAVVPVLDDGRIVLLRQYRQPLRRYVLEIPAGKMDVGGETPEEVAHRELAEEIGQDARELIHLVSFANSAGWTTETTHVYLGRGVHPVARPDGFEPEAEEADMEVVTLDADDAVALAHSGDLIDAKTLVGLLMAAPHLRAT